MKHWDSATTLSAGGFIAGVGGGIATAGTGGGNAGWAVFVGLLVLGVYAASARRDAARKMCSPNCAVPHDATHHLGWNGTISCFSFNSANYATKFAAGNQKKLINVSMQLRQLMEVKRVQAAWSPPSRPVSAPIRPTVDATIDWIARIENLKGAGARRSALQRALAEIRDPHDQQRLLLAASKIEVAAVLDKVDTLKSPEAKKRHLQKAIDDIRRDNLPDTLQADELRQFNGRLLQFA